MTPSTDAVPTNAESTAADRAHVFHSWSAQALIAPVPIAGGSGAGSGTTTATSYLDFSSQLVNLNLGHQHPRMVEAIQRQADRAVHGRSDVRQRRPQRGGRSDRRPRPRSTPSGPGPLDKVFFTNGGAEAIENAIRMAKLHTGRHKVLSAYRSYHGATAAAIAATGEPRRWPNEPSAVGIGALLRSLPVPLGVRQPGEPVDAAECERALEHLEQVVTMEGAHTIAAMILETVVGTNGVLVPPDGYLAGVRELCDRHGIVMIADEVMVGFGRIGEWFAVDHWDVVPDLISFAKGVNSGYVPLGGVIISEQIAAHVRGPSLPRRADLQRPSAARARRRSSRSGSSRRTHIPEPRRSARRGGHPPRAREAGGAPPERRRGARPRVLLRHRAGARPRHPRAARAVQRRPARRRRP